MDVYPFLSGVVPAAGGEPPNRAAIVCLFAHFRLLQTCERASHEGSLDSIDAVLGCPVGLFEVGSALVDGLAAWPLARRNVVISSVIYAVSWWVHEPAARTPLIARQIVGSSAAAHRHIVCVCGCVCVSVRVRHPVAFCRSGQDARGHQRIRHTARPRNAR